LSNSGFSASKPKAVVGTAAYAGRPEGELRGLEWTDYQDSALRESVDLEEFVNKPKTRTSADSGPVIGQSAEVLISYRSSVGDPSSGVMFHSGGGDPET
jgi:hypothetical protein